MPDWSMAGGGRFRVAYLLSVLIAAITLVQAAAGVLLGGVYRDNEWITAAYRGTDLVTLAVALPLLVAGIALSARGSARGTLVWVAMLAYTLYGYQFYLFGAAFNVFFLAYAALFALSIWALVLSVPRIDTERLAEGARLSRPGRYFVAGYMLLTAAGLGALWTAMSLGFVFTGDVPAPIVNSGHPTGVVFALDLSLIVPTLAVGAVLLLRRRPWGLFLAAVMSIKGAVYTLALTSSTLWAMSVGVEGAGAELPVWVALTVGGAVAAALMLRAVRED